MHEIGNKWNKRICKWIATVLTIVLLINQSCFSALADEITEVESCSCGTRCNADSINEACSVCVENYEKCNAAEPEEVPVQAETQEQQEVDVPEMTAQEPVETEPEIPVSQESGAGYENSEQSNGNPQTELDNTSYADESETDLEPDTEMESGSETEESSEITMTELEIVVADEMAVATQEELAVALLAGVPKITLSADVSLTTTMIVPAAANIVLDGQGFSLYRGADENGVFIGTMLYLSGIENAEEISGSLTLTNICVDGQNTGNRVGSSAIIDYGSLILDEGAVVKSNYNYGTYGSQGDGRITAVINDYGGGIQVYGELTVTERALVTGNFADEFGGGVYLAEGATLYLHADVIRENTVAEGSGYGADLYAASGSTIYYNAAIDMTRDGFYLCADVNLIGLDEPVAYADTTKDSKKEVYINLSETSGYTEAEIAALTSELGKKYTVLANRTNIDTTDLRDWYVYDHYDEHAWKALGKTWEDEYTANYKRQKYIYNETYYNDKNGVYNNSSSKNNSTVTDPVYTIEKWLERKDDYYVASYASETLAQFKEHIYTRNEDGYPKMTFVGYGNPAYIDFLFYDPDSDGEKVVNFDVDSSQVLTHTLAGSGFLVNTGIDSAGNLDGYLVYYVYSGTRATTVYLYKLTNNAARFHDGSSGLGTLIASKTITEWANQMSIQIKATPDSIEVRQQPVSVTTNINESDFVFKYPETKDESSTFKSSTYSGFGPLVAYSSMGHTCMRASSFTYSNLRMYYTNPPGDMLDALEKADFTQEDTQKYFINLFGDSGSEYNSEVGMGQYENFLHIMQTEGVALITDRKTPFKDYLGDNLCEIEKGDARLSIAELVEKISDYIDPKTTTDLTDKLQQGGNGSGEGDGSGEGNGNGLREVKPEHSVGNIWLKSASSGKQIRTVDGDSIGGGGFEIQIEDDITFYYGNPTVTYSVTKPNGEVVTYTSNSFSVGADSKKWPKGDYTVQQKISDASVQGYAFFYLKRSDPETTTNHAVKIEVRKDGDLWSEKTFALAAKNVEPIRYISVPNSAPDGTYSVNVPDGVYSVYETTGAADASAYKDMGITATVNGAGTTVTINYYTVTFYKDDDNVFGEPQIVRENETATAPTQNPTKDGYEFIGWRTSSDDSENFDFTKAIVAKTVLYAQWSATAYPVTINVNIDGAKWEDHEKTFALSANQGETFLEGEDLNHVPDGIYQIYEIIQNADDTNSYADTKATVKVNGGKAATTVYYYTITFHDGDTILDAYGTIVSKETYVIALPELSPKDGYAFNGWSTSEDGSTNFDFEKSITEKTDLYAKWLATKHKVTINVKKDNKVWDNNGKQFVLSSDEGESYLTDLTRVPDGVYKIYETEKTAQTIQAAGIGEVMQTPVYTDTGVPVTVNGADTAVTVNYYTVTFYNEGILFNGQIVLWGKNAVEPSAKPSKEGYNFYRWSTSKDTDDDTGFDFRTQIKQKTDLYAKWIKIEEKTYTISVMAGTGGSVSPSGDVLVKEGADQQFIITPNDGYEIDTVVVDGSTVVLENARFGYRTLSGSVGTELNAAEPETVVSESDTAEINPLNDDDNNSSTNAKQYIFHTVKEDHTLSATFKAIPKKKSAKKSSSSDSTPDTPASSLVKTDTRVITAPIPVPVPEPPAPVTKDSEPKTGDVSHVEVYATIGMIAGLSYLILYFSDGEIGMTEEQKKEIVGALVKWARKGSRIRKYAALAIVFVILVYYHSIGKRTTVEWKELYEK